MAGNVTGLVLTNYPARSSQDLVVALVLADAADQDGGNVFPSVRRVASLSRCGERTVQYCLQEFIRQGFLVLVEKGGGRGRPSKYRIDLGWLWSQPPVWRPFEQYGALDAPILETPQIEEKKGAKKVKKACKKGAPVGAPNPPPPTPSPATTTPTPTGGGGGEDEKLSKQDAADLLAAFDAQARALGKNSPRAWARGALRRIRQQGMAEDDHALLAAWRDLQEIERVRQARLAAPPPGLPTAAPETVTTALSAAKEIVGLSGL